MFVRWTASSLSQGAGSAANVNASTSAIIVNLLKLGVGTAKLESLRCLSSYRDGPMLWAEANDLIDKIKGNGVYIAVGVGALIVLFVLLKLATGRKKKPVDLEKGQRENLAEYPPPPPVSARRLTVNGLPVRLRLV